MYTVSKMPTSSSIQVGSCRSTNVTQVLLTYGIILHYSNVSLINQGFSFNSVDVHDIEKKLRTHKVRKSPGYDTIPAKLTKLGWPAICATVTYLINECVTSSVCPSALKRQK